MNAKHHTSLARCYPSGYGEDTGLKTRGHSMRSKLHNISVICAVLQKSDRKGLSGNEVKHMHLAGSSA